MCVQRLGKKTFAKLDFSDTKTLDSLEKILRDGKRLFIFRYEIAGGRTVIRGEKPTAPGLGTVLERVESIRQYDCRHG